MADDVEILGFYRDKPIIDTDGKFTSMGDGLSSAMKIEGGIDEPGTIVTFVVACRVGPHTLSLTDDEESWILTHKYIGGTVAKVDYDLVKEVLLTMERRQKEKADAEAKTPSLRGVDDAADQAKAEATEPDGRKVPESSNPEFVGPGDAADAEGYVDLEKNPDAPNPLVGANVGGSDAAE